MKQIARSECNIDYLIPYNSYEDAMMFVSSFKEKFKSQLSDNRFHYVELGEEYKPLYSDKEHRYYPITYRRLRITSFIGTHEWQLLGILEKQSDNTRAFSSVDGKTISCPGFFRNCEFECDCCKNTGSRKYLYIVQNRSTGWMKKIGHECLNSFTKSKMTGDITKIHKVFDELRILENAQNTNPKAYYPIRMILRLAIQLVDRYGYIKEGEKSTKELIYKMVSDISPDTLSLISELGIVGPYDRCDKELDDKVDRVWQYYAGSSSAHQSDYEQQIREILSKYKTVPYNRIGLVASIYRKKI